MRFYAQQPDGVAHRALGGSRGPGEETAGGGRNKPLTRVLPGVREPRRRTPAPARAGLRAASKPRQSRRSCVRTPCDREARMYAHHARPAQYRPHAPVQPMTQHNRGSHHHCTPTLATGTALTVGEEQQLISMVMALAPAHLRWPCFRSSRFAVASSMSSGKQTSCRARFGRRRAWAGLNSTRKVLSTAARLRDELQKWSVCLRTLLLTASVCVPQDEEELVGPDGAPLDTEPVSSDDD